jgi:lipoate---protein ligase
MMQNYQLPDLKLFTPRENLEKDLLVWQPEKTVIVIGNGSKEDKELKKELVAEDKIPVIRRTTGGLSVVLSNKMLCVSIAYYEEKLIDPKMIFYNSNKIIIDALESLGIKKIKMQGISDLTIGNKKISGSSIFQNNKLKFFHSVLNVKEDVSLIEKYLNYPDREPDYRKGRSHKEFVTSLFDEGYIFSFDEIKEALLEEWNKK